MKHSLFLPRDAMRSADDVVRCLSVCPSIRPSVRHIPALCQNFSRRP